MTRLYADENFPYPAVVELRRLGHDELTAAEAGQAGSAIPDADVLASAHAQGRALLTHNRKDFRHLHNQFQAHSGLILCTRDSSFTGPAARIDLILSQTPVLSGRMIRVNRSPA